MRAACCAGLVAAAIAAPARGDTIDTRGMAPHEACAICHELDGNSRVARFPRLAGQAAAYLRKQLEDFRAGRRSNDEGAMSGTAQALSALDLEAVVRHFAVQTARPSAAAAPDRAALGARLYARGRGGLPACAGCHDASVRATSGAPRLAGQHAGYLAKQLADFRTRARANDPGAVMRDVAAALRPEEAAALAAWLAAAPVMTGAVR